MGRMLVVIGLVIAGLGLVLAFADRVPLLGRLPGDLSFSGDGWAVYIPIATSLLLSVVLTLALNFVGLLRR